MIMISLKRFRYFRLRRALYTVATGDVISYYYTLKLYSVVHVKALQRSTRRSHQVNAVPRRLINSRKAVGILYGNHDGNDKRLATNPTLSLRYAVYAESRTGPRDTTRE